MGILSSIGKNAKNGILPPSFDPLNVCKSELWLNIRTLGAEISKKHYLYVDFSFSKAEISIPRNGHFWLCKGVVRENRGRRGPGALSHFSVEKFQLFWQHLETLKMG